MEHEAMLYVSPEGRIDWIRPWVYEVLCPIKVGKNHKTHLIIQIPMHFAAGFTKPCALLVSNPEGADDLCFYT